MKEKLTAFFSGTGYIFESFSEIFNFDSINVESTTQADDTRAISSDWKNIGMDIKGAISEFESSKK